MPDFPPSFDNRKIYEAVRDALQDVLERVVTNPTNVSLVYDEAGRVKQIIKFDTKTMRSKIITLHYDEVGNLVRKEEKWV